MTQERDKNIIEEIEEFIKKSNKYTGSDYSLAAIEMAIGIEKMSKDHYLRLARKSNNKSAKSMFIYLAREEGEQVKLLQAQESALKHDRKWLSRDKIKSAKQVCPLISPAKEEIKSIEDIIPSGSKFKREPSDIEALKMAIEIKKRTILFYCETSKKISDPRGKRMFSDLIYMENKHLNELEVQYAWLDQAGFWYDPDMMTD